MSHKTEWVVLGASVAGTSHIQSNMPCQDAHLVLQMEVGDAGSILIVAVADGASSAVFSQQGAVMAVDVAVSSIAEAIEMLVRPLSGSSAALPERGQQADDVDCQSSSWKDTAQKDAIDWQQLVQNAFQVSHAAIAAHAQTQQHSISDYHTTLVLAVVTGEEVIAGMIGDGAVVAERNVEIEQVVGQDISINIEETDSVQQTELVSLCQPQRGEYANSTYFLTQPNFTEHVTIDTHAGRYKAVAVLTDGLLPLAMNIAKNRPHRPFFEPLFKFVQSVAADDQGDEQEIVTGQEHLATFLDSARINQRTDDDKTLVVAVRKRTK